MCVCGNRCLWVYGYQHLNAIGQQCVWPTLGVCSLKTVEIRKYLNFILDLFGILTKISF